MSDSNREAIVETSRASEQGALQFGQVVARLVDAGVESYAVDFRMHTATYYVAGDETVSVGIASPDAKIAAQFDIAAIRRAILSAQKDEVRYPEFKRLAYEAGCVGYTVWIAGKHVTYYGRMGETHVEPFPR